MDDHRALLDKGKEQVVASLYRNLWLSLMDDPDGKEAYERFRAGLRLANLAYAAALEIMGGPQDGRTCEPDNGTGDVGS